MEEIRKLQEEFDRAELDADADALDRLLADDFRSIGPKGFVLDKAQWIGRHERFKYHRLDTSDMEIRSYPRAAIVRNIQRNDATHGDDHVQLAVRVSQTWVQLDDGWRLAGIQFSPLAEG
jgi:hypothetical protein